MRPNITAMGSCTIVLIFGMAGSIGFANTSEQGPAWRQISNDGGMTLYVRDHDVSDIISIRAEARIKASADDIFFLMTDTDTIRLWSPNLVDHKVIKPIGSNGRIEYSRMDFPWPFSDRYMVVRGFAFKGEDGSYRITAQSEKTDHGIVESDKVEMIVYHSQFILTPEQHSVTRVELEINSDPRGFIPEWLINAIQRRWPRKYLTALVLQLQKMGKYDKDAGQPVGH